MARRPVSGVARDGAGNIVASATVALTVYSTGLAATCYAAQSGGSALTNGQTTSGSDGSYTFWIDDGDYSLISLFNIAVSKTGYTPMTTPVGA